MEKPVKATLPGNYFSYISVVFRSLKPLEMPDYAVKCLVFPGQDMGLVLLVYLSSATSGGPEYIECDGHVQYECSDILKDVKED